MTKEKEIDYTKAMEAVYLPECEKALKHQFRVFFEAALPLIEDDNKPAWVHAAGIATFYLERLKQSVCAKMMGDYYREYEECTVISIDAEGQPK